MADEDEIDVLGEFSFNSCFALNNQGIPSCSNREDTVHPQWLLDSTANNWYDTQSNCSNRNRSKLTKQTLEKVHRYPVEDPVTWNQVERDLLARQLAKYGRNIRKISETIKSKTEAEIQALIEAEYGINLDIPTFGLEKHEDHEDVPAVVQEEIVTADTNMVDNLALISKKALKKRYNNEVKKNKGTRQREQNKKNTNVINESDLFHEQNLMLSSMQSIPSNLDKTDIVINKISNICNTAKPGKKIGNHRRKHSRNYGGGRVATTSRDLLKTPPGRQRKDSGLSEDNTKSPKMQIVLGSGVALPVSEGEQVIKLEKKKESDPDSDIDIDVDSDKDDLCSPRIKEDVVPKLFIDDAPIASPLRKFEPMPRRQRKIHLDGGGGYTIMHTESGDLYEISSEPRKERQPRKQAIHLIQCRFYNAEKPAPFSVTLHVSALVSMELHAHSSHDEVMGLLGGEVLSVGPTLAVQSYRPVAAAASGTHCDMDAVSQAQAAEAVLGSGQVVVGWHHSHPRFAASPSALDLRSQRTAQRALRRRSPFVGLITSQHWPVGRTASHYRCIWVEEDENSPEDEDTLPTGYQLSVRVEGDLKEGAVDDLLREMAACSSGLAALRCPDTNLTHFDKCISSVSHHLRSAGYTEDDPVTVKLLQGIRDVFR